MLPSGKVLDEQLLKTELQQKAKAEQRTLPPPFQEETNINVGLIVQDTVYNTWLVVSKAVRHQGLGSRFLIQFACGRMIGLLKHATFLFHHVSPIVKELFQKVRQRYSP